MIQEESPQAQRLAEHIGRVALTRWRPIITALRLLSGRIQRARLPAPPTHIEPELRELRRTISRFIANQLPAAEEINQGHFCRVLMSFSDLDEAAKVVSNVLSPPQLLRFYALLGARIEKLQGHARSGEVDA